MLNKVFVKIIELARGGLFHIFGSSVFAQLLGMISSMVVVRFLPKDSYGYYAGANNNYSYLAVFIGCGMASAMLQFCSEHVRKTQKNAVYLYALKQGSMSNILLAFCVLALAKIRHLTGDVELASYLAMMCLLPFVSYFNSYIQIILRIQSQNIMYSRIQIFQAAAAVVGNILLSRLLFVPGLILSAYLTNMIAAFVGVGYLRSRGFFKTLNDREPLAKDYKREILKYALLCAITNFSSTMLVLLDVTCLDVVLSDPTVLADYKTAATIPSACVLVPSALTTYFYPQIVAKFSSDKTAFPQYLKKMQALYLSVNSIVCVGLLVFAPLVVYIIYGSKYMNNVPLFRMLSLNFFVYGSTRHLYGNVIAAMKKSEVNLAISVFCGFANIALNLLLIPKLGSMGAAVATLLISVSVGIISGSYLLRTFHQIKKQAY